MVIPLGFTNIPATFQYLINSAFADFFDIFLITYLDYLLVYNASESKHFAYFLNTLNAFTLPSYFLRSLNAFSQSEVRLSGTLLVRVR